MRNFWIVNGSEENWRQAFTSRGIWGLEETKLDKIYWLALKPEDIVLFYISGKIKGIVGYGIVRSKFYQNVPLWKDEIKKSQVIWPLRFEFDVEFLLPQEMWMDKKISIPKGAEFRQPLIFKNRDEIEPIIRQLNPNVPAELLEGTSFLPADQKPEIPSPSHETIKKLLVEIGKMQGYIADSEFLMGTERLDAVWRRLPESVPTFVFEVQVGGDLYHALGKLKHAYDIWNSRIFLVGGRDILSAVNQMLSGTFHEIQPVLRFIDIEKIQNLHKSKSNINQIEKELGLIP